MGVASGVSAVVWIVVAAVTVVLVVGGWLIGTYNAFVRLRNLVEESWRQVDVELNRRHDLIPNLLETVKGYVAHEQSLLLAVTQARAAASQPGLSRTAQAQVESELSTALGRLFAVSEGYPQLMASQAFVQLQGELANTEDRIAAGRRFYNANVRSLNTKVETFPASLAAGMFHITRAEYFEPTAPDYRALPQVSFGATPTPPMPSAAPAMPGMPPVPPAFPPPPGFQPPTSPGMPPAPPGMPPAAPGMPPAPPVAPPGPQA